MNIKKMIGMCDHTDEFWKQPWPYDYDSERIMIGFLLNDLSLFVKADAILGRRACDKLSITNGDILEVLRWMRLNNKECSLEEIVNMVTRSKIRVYDLKKMKSLAAHAPLPFVFYCYMVARHEQLRNILSLTRDIAEGAFSCRDPSALQRLLQSGRTEPADWKKITEKFPEDVKDVPVFPFGKFSGRPIKEIIHFSPDYIKWFLSISPSPSSLKQEEFKAITEYINNNQNEKKL